MVRISLIMIINVELLKNKGNLLFKEKKFNEALEIYSEAISICNDNQVLQSLHSNISNTYIYLKKFYDAEEAAKLCIKCNDKWYKGYLRLALSKYYLNKFEECQENLNIARIKCETREQKKDLEELENKLFKKRRKFLPYMEEESTTQQDKVSELLDWLMSQFIKPHEEDAFRYLGEYFMLNSPKTNYLSDENAFKWLQFGLKYGPGDSPYLLDLLKEFCNSKEEQKKLEILSKIKNNYIV